MLKYPRIEPTQLRIPRVHHKGKHLVSPLSWNRESCSWDHWSELSIAPSTFSLQRRLPRAASLDLLYSVRRSGMYTQHRWSFIMVFSIEYVNLFILNWVRKLSKRSNDKTIQLIIKSLTSLIPRRCLAFSHGFQIVAITTKPIYLVQLSGFPGLPSYLGWL